MQRLARPGRRIRRGDCPSRRGLHVRMEGRARGSEQAVAVRLVRQRPRRRRSHSRVHRTVRPQGSHRNAKGASKMTLLNDIQVWTAACRYDYLIPNRGVGVLLPDGAQAALFRLDDGSLRAVGNIDPFSGAAVMSRGIVGDRGGRTTVQTPIKKQAFALDNGICLDDPDLALPLYATRIVDGYVEVGV